LTQSLTKTKQKHAIQICHEVNLLLLSAAILVNAATAVEPVNLRTAEDYVILAKTGISTVPTSAITGDIAVSPISATAITGFGLVKDLKGEFSTALQITGKAYAADNAAPIPTHLTTAVSDMETAYAYAAGLPNDDAARINLGGGAIGSQTLTTGVYTFGKDISFSSDVTFDAAGDPNAVFILQTTGNLMQAASTDVILKNGALAKNIFWQVAGHVQVGAGSLLQGVVLVKTNALFMTGSSLNGRVFAQTACDLQQAVITKP
jgi:hypothetical protein